MHGHMNVKYDCNLVILRNNAEAYGCTSVQKNITGLVVQSANTVPPEGRYMSLISDL
jgi:hypothetical protein